MYRKALYKKKNVLFHSCLCLSNWNNKDDILISIKTSEVIIWTGICLIRRQYIKPMATGLAVLANRTLQQIECKAQIVKEEMGLEIFILANMLITYKNCVNLYSIREYSATKWSPSFEQEGVYFREKIKTNGINIASVIPIYKER